MSDWPAVLFNEAESHRLADLAGIAADLRSTAQFCDAYLAMRNRGSLEPALIEALCNAALIRYGRAFGKGVRTSVEGSELLAGLDPSDQQAHGDFKDLRDKWIAHSVNAFEENEVILWLMPPERGPMEIVDATVRERRVVGLDEAGVTRLRDLANRVLSAAETLIGLAKMEVLDAARKLPLEDVYARGFTEPSELGPDSHSKARARRPTPRSRRGPQP